MGKIPIDEIKQACRLEDFIERNCPEIRLKKTGLYYKGYCPFHKNGQERTPSLTVNPVKNTFTCYGCHERGSIIDFIMKKFDLEFKEACRMAADDVGIVYTEGVGNPAFEAYKATFDAHNRRYWTELRNNNVVLDYLTQERGISQQILDYFRVGLVPGDEYKTRKDLGGISGRICFPIMEMKNIKTAQCVGMGYRTLQPVTNVNPKYINDHNQEGKDAVYDKDTGALKRPAQDPNLAGCFIKGNLLYGFPQAQEHIRKQNYAIIVEGYVDVLSMHQAGLANTVGAMGTALTKEQMLALRKLTRNIMLFLDGDDAGIDNMIRVLPELFDLDFNVMMMIAQNKMDAADVCKLYKFENATVKNYVTTNSLPAMEFIINRATKNYERVVIRERMRALQEVTPFLDKVISEYDKVIFQDMLYKKLDIKR